MQNKLLDIEDTINENSQQELEMGETSGNSKVYQTDEVDEGFGKQYQSISDDVVNIKLHKQFLSDDEKRNYVLDEENSQPPPQVIKKQKNKNKKPKSKSSRAKNLKKKLKYQQKPFKWSTYRFLLQYPIRHWKLGLIANFLIIMTALLGVYLPWIMGQLLDSTTKNNDEDMHRSLSIIFFKVLLTLAVVQFLRAFTNHVWQEKIYIDMRHDVLSQFLGFDINFYKQYRTGEIISRLMNDLQAAKSAVSNNIIAFFRNIIMCVSNVTVLFILSWKVTLALITIMPLFTIATMIYSRLQKKYLKINQQYQADLTTVVEEIVSGITTVKSFNGEPKALKRFDLHLEYFLKLAYRKAINEGFYQFNNAFFIQMGSLIVLWYGGILVLNNSGELTPGELASFILYAIQLGNSSSTISETYSKIISATGAFEGVLEMLRYQPIVKEQIGALTEFSFNGDIEFKNIYFQYPNTSVPILKNFNLKIQQGEYLAFVGMSGSGKSTVISLIERFYDAQVGKILLDGVNIKEIQISTLRSFIGFVSQEPILFEGTIESNIAYGIKDVKDEDLIWASKASGAWSFINNPQLFPKGLKSRVGEKGNNLSGGQKQRIAIARALIKRPKLLIFDEATSALDAENEYLVQSSIDELIQNKEQITIIVIAHRLSTIVNCNRIIVFQSGEVIGQGSHNELLETSSVYKQLVDRQMMGIQIQTSENNEETETDTDSDIKKKKN